jgi:uncharacterized protein YigA (DUF484 family)
MAAWAAAVDGVTIDGVNSGIAVLVGLVTLMSLTFGGVALVRASLRSGDVKALREANGDLRGRVDDLKDEAVERDRRIETLEATLAAETNARQTLEKVVTGRELLEAIQKQILTHDAEVIDHHRTHDLRADDRHAALISALKEMRRDIIGAIRSSRPDGTSPPKVQP